MGHKLFDQYTYLHFAVGIVIYYWHISLRDFIILHTIFEIFENTQMGMDLINKYIVFWPGGKYKSDTIINMTGDTLGAILGWLSAYFLDQLGNKYGWYSFK
tara:strand:+ start:1280 stop:1582 length:303 start_codon:yes stop_codon:yes gene_type:complete